MQHDYKHNNPIIESYSCDLMENKNYNFYFYKN